MNKHSLEDTRQDLENLISGLRQAIEHFENVQIDNVSSSPVELLLEAAIDISLLLGLTLIEGRPSLRKNPELIFSDSEVDSLGNPKQKVVYKEDPVWLDPVLGHYLKTQVASFFVALKNRQSLPKSLKLLELAGVDSPDPVSKTQAQKNLEKQRERRDALKKKRQEQYYRRRQRNKNPKK